MTMSQDQIRFNRIPLGGAQHRKVENDDISRSIGVRDSNKWWNEKDMYCLTALASWADRDRRALPTKSKFAT